MEMRYMTYKNEEGQKERFYPITHKDAIVGLSDVPEVSRNDLISTEAASEIVGDAPEIDPAIIDLVNSLTAEDVGAVSNSHSYVNLSTSLLSYAFNNTPEGLTFFTLSGDTYTGNDVPTENCKYGHGYISRRSNDADVMLVEAGSNSVVYFNHCHRNTWSGWTNRYLPLTGGTLSGDDYVALKLKDTVANTLTTIEHYSKAFMITLQEKGNTDSSQIVKFQMNCNPAEPLSNKLRFINDDNFYRIFGEHNKPSGSYIGNGSATNRTINTGGIGNALLITTNYGDMAIVTKSGALIMKAGTVSGLSSTHAKFSDGILTLATTETALNENSKGYTYQVL